MFCSEAKYSLLTTPIVGNKTKPLTSKEVHAKSLEDATFRRIAEPDLGGTHVQVERQGRLRVLNTNHGVVELQSPDTPVSSLRSWRSTRSP
jgi:hypothetical protein